jgi:Protein of unknown function (DUF3887)
VPPDSDPFADATADLGRAVRGLDEVVDLAGPGLAASIARIHDALEVRRRADRVLAAAVDAVRADGGTWQQIGDALGTTRQAAFQRFGRPIDPRTGRAMDKTTLDGADARTIEIFAALGAGDWTAVHGRFDPTMAEALPPERLADTWATVVGTVGVYERPGEPFVRRQGDFTVVDLPLAFEAGDMTGRVTFRTDGRVAGLFVLAPEQARR